jgi:uncharacterized membrane protein
MAKPLTQKQWQELSKAELKIIENLLPHINELRDVNEEYVEDRTLGERAADAVAKVAGSWSFIILFLTSLLMWAFLNTEILGPRNQAFDPYPYVFLNLVLSMLAAVQAPIIMMSQNRQSERDRLDAEIDHEVNVRAEAVIHKLDEKLELLQQSVNQLQTLQGLQPK